ncbi:MAG TPA: glucose 1-dehydrogenase [Ktedonobacteraceae bacterium]|nr:glucose 1-dehydrogenase [Ktedonobacteraceae bacterium]
MRQRKTVVITGSTKGIGKAIALHLAQQPYNIVLNYASDTRQAQETLALCQQATPHVLLVKADVSNKRAVEALMQESVQVFGSLDVLINNAACVIDKSVLEMSEDDWDQVIATNMKGTFLCSQAAASYMLRQEEGGSILNIGASSGLRGRKNGINTCASKAGIIVMTQCLALELGPKIRVNTIIPGLTKTEETTKRFHLDDPAVVQARTETIPLQRIGTPQDIAHAVTLLLADDAGFITGQKLVVDGGQYMW